MRLLCAYSYMAWPISRRLDEQITRFVNVLALDNAGNSNAISMAIMAVTTSNSTSVKPLIEFRRITPQCPELDFTDNINDSWINTKLQLHPTNAGILPQIGKPLIFIHTFENTLPWHDSPWQSVEITPAVKLAVKLAVYASGLLAAAQPQQH